MWRPDRSADRLTDDQRRELDALDRMLAGEPPASEAEGRLASLAVAVRDDRPPRSPDPVAALDARVAAGFPRRGRGRGRRRSPGWVGAAAPRTAGRWDPRRLGPRHWLGGLGTVAALAAVVAVVAGAVRPGGPATAVDGKQQLAPSGGVAAGPARGAATPAPPSASSAGGAPTVGPMIPAPSPIPPPPPPPTTTGGARAVQRDATLGLVAAPGQVQRVTDRAIAAIDGLGGIVASSQISLDDQGGSQATLELEVPGAALDRTLAALSALAHVGSRTQDALDITDATGAARERLAESRAERQALLRQLARATTANQLASIRAQLGLVGGRIAQDEAQLQSLRQRAQLANLSVTITEDQQAAGGGSGWGPGAALDDALSVLEAVFAVLVIALAGFVPAALVGGLAWWAARPLRRRRREAALVA